MLIYGYHSIVSNIKNLKPINKIWITENNKYFKEIKTLCSLNNIPLQIVNKLKIKNLVGDNVLSQGIVADIAAKKYENLRDILNNIKNSEPFLLLVDNIHDPRNLGALIRTAHASGVHGIIIPKHRNVGITDTVSKVASGSIEYVQICRCNIVNAINELKNNNIWVVGIEKDGKNIYYKTNLKGAIALVIGGEDKGLSRLVKESCDFTVHIPMLNQASSLNAAVAGAIVMYEVFRQRNIY